MIHCARVIPPSDPACPPGPAVSDCHPLPRYLERELDYRDPTSVPYFSAERGGAAPSAGEWGISLFSERRSFLTYRAATQVPRLHVGATYRNPALFPTFQPTMILGSVRGRGAKPRAAPNCSPQRSRITTTIDRRRRRRAPSVPAPGPQLCSVFRQCRLKPAWWFCIAGASMVGGWRELRIHLLSVHSKLSNSSRNPTAKQSCGALHLAKC